MFHKREFCGVLSSYLYSYGYLQAENLSSVLSVSVGEKKLGTEKNNWKIGDKSKPAFEKTK